jgi:drug/metabolite transporter (DMT)-like permease
MDPILVAAALFSAVLHASWNAAVKASRNPAQAATGQMCFAALIGLPWLYWTGLPAMESLAWIALSTAINTVTVPAMLRAYALAGFGLVYPVIRAVAVLLIVPLAAAVAGEHVGPWGLVGVAVIALSLLTLAFDAARAEAGRVANLKALGWTLAAGLGTAAYVICDAQGVRASGSPWAYGIVVSLTNALAMLVRQRHNLPAAAELPGVLRVAVPGGIASMASYLLILWVFSLAPIAPAAALRDTSALFAIVIAALFLRERFTVVRVAAVALAAAAVPLLRLG